ncbi:DNA polymerase III subunit delta [Sneathiella sp.]|uniref:DNA polymerase III subunit delta n=1 Tax=Sneathiella sp. TaxID=1964365 RepID=UPI002610D636|nr:DNA polymerase III subunit delta [Sneathiella sp.]MDF2369106.1 DNA polymerase III subunit delta [Sneathiella sp.]
MELKSNQIPAFLKSRDPKYRIFLLFGPDEGLVRELSRAICVNIVESLDDPFRFLEMEASDLSNDPARLLDEVTAISMMGGERVVRLRGATNNAKGYIEPVLELDLTDSVLVIEAGDIRKDSALVKMISKAPNGAVTPCFHDKAQDILSLINEVLGAANLTPSREVMEYLRENLGSDRAISRGELEKLVLYMHGRTDPITLADARANIGDSSAQSIFDVIDATLLGDLNGLEKYLTRAFSAGESPIGFLRMIQNQLKQLHKAAAIRDAGARAEDAIRKAGIPFFNQKKAAAEIGGKSSAHFATCLEITLDAEMKCKSTGYPDEAICRRALMRIAMANRRR